MENLSDIVQYIPEQAQNLNVCGQHSQCRHPCQIRCFASIGYRYAGPTYRFYKQTTALFSNLRCYLPFLVLNGTAQYNSR